MMYQRVLPRDLFNEAKLLKCMGHLCLKIHEGLTPCKMKIAEETFAYKNNFDVELMSEGSLWIPAIAIFIEGELYKFKTTYNSKANFPLYVEHNNVDYLVFNEEGAFDNEFREFIKLIK